MRHMLSHTGQRLYGCDLCQKHFSRKDNLHKHRTTHGVTGPLVCEVCGWFYILEFIDLSDDDVNIYSSNVYCIR